MEALLICNDMYPNILSFYKIWTYCLFCCNSRETFLDIKPYKNIPSCHRPAEVAMSHARPSFKIEPVSLYEFFFFKIFYARWLLYNTNVCIVTYEAKTLLKSELIKVWIITYLNLMTNQNVKKIKWPITVILLISNCIQVGIIIWNLKRHIIQSLNWPVSFKPT